MERQRNEAPPLVMIKLGGSLYDLDGLPDLLAQLRDWFRVGESYARATPLLLPGGGKTADVVRDWQQSHAIDEDQAHWLACEALDLNARLIQSILPQSVIVDDPLSAHAAWEEGRFPLLATSHALKREEQFSWHQEPSAPGHPGHEPLPHIWDVTSDSLAAWLALRFGAERLLLIKSVPVPAGRHVTEAARRGWIDPYFPGLAGHLPVIDWCDGRSLPLRYTTWLESGLPVGSA